MCVVLSAEIPGISLQLHSAVCGNVGAACAFNLVYLVTTEAFPTVFRGTVFGFVNLWGRVGGVAAPLVGGVARQSFMYPILENCSHLCSASMNMFAHESTTYVLTIVHSN